MVRLDITHDNKNPTIEELYTYIKNNINTIQKDPAIHKMLDPENNSTTRLFLGLEQDRDEAFAKSYLITVILMSQIYGIFLKN